MINALTSVPAGTTPAQIAFDRTFYFSIFLPFLHLTERVSKNILVDPEFNDATLAATNICVSCFHLAEHAATVSTDLVGAVKSFEDWPKFGDVANSRKHHVRTSANKQVQVLARLAFLFEDEKFGFIETEIVATCPAWGPINLTQLIGKFIGHYVSKTGAFGGSFEQLSPIVNELLPIAIVKQSAETYYCSQSTFTLYTRDPITGDLSPAPEVPITVEAHGVEVPETQIGRYRIKYGQA